MLDLNFLPKPRGGNTEIFYGTNQWQTWLKPKGKIMAHILLIGAGARGGTGYNAANTTGAGAGGGGSGGQTSLILPISILPDILHLYLESSIDNTAPTTFSTIGISESQAPRETFCAARCGSNGGDATNTIIGNGGAGANAATVSIMPLGWAFTDSVLAGQVGANGSLSGVAGINTSLTNTGLLVTGGAGGGGSNAGGGSIVGSGIYPTIPQASVGIVGSNGISVLYVLYGGGGGGGGNGSIGTGGYGGNGSYGCGGGGSAANISNGILQGGYGGDAICFITTW